jgi:hypothetical protein
MISESKGFPSVSKMARVIFTASASRVRKPNVDSAKMAPASL